MHPTPKIQPTKQRGAALVVSLVILAVVSLIGVAAMQNSSLELKLVASTKDRATAFQAAEAALTLYENTLNSSPPDLAFLSNDCPSKVGTPDNCFVDCTDADARKRGLCFQGTYINGQGKASCALGTRAPIDPVQEIINNNSRPQNTGILTPVNGNERINVLVEFLCFVEKPNGSSNKARVRSEENSSSNTIDALNANLVPLFRLTAVAEGDAQRSRVVMQTTYRLAN